MDIELIKIDNATFFIKVNKKIIGTLFIAEGTFIVHILNGYDDILCKFNCIHEVSNFICGYMEGFEDD